jgi:hypothetical protein
LDRAIAAACDAHRGCSTVRPVTSTPRRASRAPHIACALVAALICAWALFGAARGHFSGDSGVKFAQSVELWRTGFASKALSHDTAIDPERRWAPYTPLVGTYRGERQGIYSLVFTGVGAPAIAAFGLDGIVVLPLLGTLLCLVGVLLLGQRLALSPWVTSAAIAVTGLATPLLFYAAQYQEHTLAAGLVTIGLALVTPDAAGRRRPALAGALVALAATVRPECYCALPALGLAALVQPELDLRRLVRDGLWLVAGAVPVLAAYWGLNLLASGTWDPLVFHNRGKKAPPNTPQLLLFGPVQGQPWPGLSLTLHVAIYAALLPLHRLPATARAIARALGAAALVAVGVWAFRHQSDRVLLGFLAATPFLGAALIAGPWRPRAGALWLFVLVFAVEVIHFDRSGVAGGLQLGARFLLPVIPAMVVVIAAMLDQELRSPSWIARGAAIAVAVAMLAVSFEPARVGLRKSELIARGAEIATAQALAVPGDVVVTRRWWESQVLSPVILHGKRIFDVGGDPGLLLARLRAQGVTDFALVARKDQRFSVPGGGEARTAERWPGWLEIQRVTISPPSTATTPSR